MTDHPQETTTTLARERNQLARQRVHLANERTFLAWLRTALAIMAFGFVLEKLHIILGADMMNRLQIFAQGRTQQPVQEWSMHLGRLSLVSFCISGFLMIVATMRFFSVRRKIHEAPEDFSPLPDLLVFGAVAGILIMGLLSFGHLL